MKALIWIISTFVIVLLNELLGLLIDFKLSYLIVFLLASAISTALTKAFLGEEAAGKKKAPAGQSLPPVGSGPFPGGWTCPQCGTHQMADANFCDSCGMQKPAPAPQPAPPEPPQPKYEPTQPEIFQQAPVVPVQPQYESFTAPQSYQPPAQQSYQFQANPHWDTNLNPQSVQQPAAIRFYVSSLNTEVNVTRASFTVGRDATSDLSLARLPNAQYIARRQASFFCSGGTWYIRDENSTNGTLLNNRRIPGGQPQALNVGDFISFAGKETLIVRDLK